MLKSDRFIYKFKRCSYKSKESIKNQINFKLDLSEIKKENPNLELKFQISAIQNVEKNFWFKKTNHWFF